MEILQSLFLRIGDKLNPNKNPRASWIYALFPALISSIVLLTNFVDSKPTVGSIEIRHPSFKKLLHPNMEMEIITTGSIWTEGPLWIEDEKASSGYLLYSDTRMNKIYKWEEGKEFFNRFFPIKKTLHTEMSGCIDKEYCDKMREPGSNGLVRMNGALMPIGEQKNVDLLACQHGDRAITLIKENGERILIATHYQGKRLNSPNDICWSIEGNLYFTDPPYGLLNKNGEEIERELNYSGVYMILKEDIKQSIITKIATNNVILLDNEMSLPNGLAFSPDFKHLYVSNSDPKNAYWKIFDVSQNNGNINNGKLSNPRIFYDANPLIEIEKQRHGSEKRVKNPDGLRIDFYGNIFGTGPGGVFVFNPFGEIIGKFNFEKPCSNLCFGGDGFLYFTVSDTVVRIRINTKPTSYMSSHFLER